MVWSLTQVKRGLQLAWWGSLLAFENRHLHKHTYVKAFWILVAFNSLRNVDTTYLKKHEGEQNLRASYAPALENYQYGHGGTEVYLKEMFQYLKRTWNQIKIALLLYFLSLLPYVGKFVYPAASAYALVNSLGYLPAITVGVFMYIIPGTKPFAMIFLETLYSSRAMMRELLEPYFGRIHFDSNERRKWFREREGILFGFSIGFYPLVRIPLLGMLFYGIAQSATALLLVKTTEPPPPPGLESTYKIDYHYIDSRNKKKQQKNE
ncbi:7438_t:CDS:2 [Funneliformis geosporum]|uniref:15452_t:CDS:1 n=1 Tax=Funneliformis geosporum TaxID=1117311 RepID=A0A9W4WTB0_9GLOM|nr:7435_t:CDS:2 [Funneliformis geosporum]CAI2176644.1 7438_t:CDS:2 [Funneliformis geosporum]CAI2184359.1 15452_t:CDS:2 [Funneliformis geosporum]